MRPEAKSQLIRKSLKSKSPNQRRQAEQAFPGQMPGPCRLQCVAANAKVVAFANQIGDACELVVEWPSPRMSRWRGEIAASASR